jgi:hypothetical protein
LILELMPRGNGEGQIYRDSARTFKETDDVGRTLAQDRRRIAKTIAKPGQGDRGDGSAGR